MRKSVNERLNNIETELLTKLVVIEGQLNAINETLMEMQVSVPPMSRKKQKAAARAQATAIAPEPAVETEESP